MRIAGFGHALFAICVAGLAVMSLVYGDFAPLLAPLPSPTPGTYGAGALLLAAAAGLVFERTARCSALLVSAYAAWWLLSRARALLHAPYSVGAWYGVAEALGPLLGAWILYSTARRPPGTPAATGMTGARALTLARALFGASCVAYGLAHFAYVPLTASMVPRWLPDRTGLALLTGVGHAGAGVCLLVGVLPRLAATLEATMMSLFGVLVWLPIFFARPAPEWAPSTQIQWSETLLTFLLAASGWIVATSQRSRPWGFSAAGTDESPPVVG